MRIEVYAGMRLGPERARGGGNKLGNWRVVRPGYDWKGVAKQGQRRQQMDDEESNSQIKMLRGQH
jgi:hypothetical protein